jgi:DNA invertase Pin-like site-specific DNA recombinase
MKGKELSGRKVIGYVRVSTEEQTLSGAGLEAQRDAIRKECDRNGWTLTAIIEDQGISGKTLNRPGLQQALDILRRGEASALVAAKLDRISRSTIDACQIGDMALKYGWDLILLDARIDTTTPHGRAQLALMATFAQLERELIAQRTREALAVKRAQGVRLGGPVAIGNDVAARIVALKSQGKTLRTIADILNNEGIAPARGGSQWYASTVRVVLQREAA